MKVHHAILLQRGHFLIDFSIAVLEPLNLLLAHTRGQFLGGYIEIAHAGTGGGAYALDFDRCADLEV